MASDAFAISLPFILQWEGGFVDHPADPGGRTNRGVTQRVYDDWRQRRGLPRRDVKSIDMDEVQAIYEEGYWIPPHCEELQRNLDLVQFDTAVNMGVGRAVRFLQQSLGCGVDGAFGSETRCAVDACKPGDTIARYCDLREAFYRGIVERKPSQSVFLKGWMNRLNSLRREVGVPGFASARGLEIEAAAPTARIPDFGVDPSYDF